MSNEVPNPLTYEEHQEFGREIQRTRTRMQELANVVADVYGDQSSTAADFRKLNEALERVAAGMQGQAEADCPGLNAGEFYAPPPVL